MESKTQKIKRVLHEEGVGGLLGKGIKKILMSVQLLYAPFVIFKLKKIKTQSIAEALSCVLTLSPFRIVQSMQVPEEIRELLTILKEKQPKTLLEIGTARGGTLFLFCLVASSDAIVVSVDLPAGKFGGGYKGWKKIIYKQFALKNQKLILLRTNSQDENTLLLVQKHLDGKKADFVFIDGDHSYEGVKRDFMLYKDVVAKGGMIGLHDIVEGDTSMVGGVPQFWNELKATYTTREIIKDKSQGGYGIGLVLL